MPKEPAPSVFCKINFKKREFNFTEKQVNVLNHLLHEETNVVFLSGVAGTSKTYLAVYAALNLLDRDHDKEIVYVRSCIESASRSLGYLPGLAEEKWAPYMMPLMDKVEEMLTAPASKSLFETGKINAIPVNFLRGASWRDKIVIIDEAQSMTVKELTTILTRVGEGTKVFVLGDPLQSDINGNSGFAPFFKAFTGGRCEDRGIYTFEFGKEDIVRSEILKFIVERIETIQPPKH
jgi:phosphate starvation-inducible protein PhoH and related proteins